MWEAVLIPILSMIIGFLMGVMVGDGGSKNMQFDELRKEQRKMRRELEVMRRRSDEKC